MRKMLRCTFVLALVAAPAAFAQTTSDSAGWTTLFNGTDFTGWKVSGNRPTFAVVDGALVANGTVAHAFYDGPFMNHDFKNFELMVDCKTLPGSNGGIYVHTDYQEAGFPKNGFEIQVNATHTDTIKSGSLYHVKDITAEDIKGITKDGEWFTEHIIVQDNAITIKLNGKEVVKWTQPADWNGGREGPGRVISHGTIAFQGHDPKSTVYYKNVRIKPLK